MPTAPISIESITSTMGEMKSSYEAAKRSKFVNVPPDLPYSGVGADYHTQIETELMFLIEFARHIERNDPAVPQGVHRFASNVIQSQGFTYKPDTGSDALDKLQKERWDEWADDDNRYGCDYTGEMNWHDFETLSVVRQVFDGDLVLNPLNSGHLQAFEAHQIVSPIANAGEHLVRNRLITNGIEKNRRKQVTRYWLHPDNFFLHHHRGPVRSRGVRSWVVDENLGTVERNCFHVYSPNRFNQSRGVSCLAPILQTAGMHGDVEFAKLVQQQMVSFIGFTHEVPLATPNYKPPDYQETICPRTGRTIRQAPKLTPGSNFWPMYPGEKINAFSASIPNAEFFDHAKLLLTFMSLSLGMPLILFLLDASETNFSAWRGALDQAKLQFRQFQRTLMGRLHRPVNRWRTRLWIAEDPGLARYANKNGTDIFNHEWIPPTWPYIEPLKDIQAAAMEISTNMISPRRVAARRNLNYETIIAEKCEDEAMTVNCAMEKAMVLNKHPYIVANPDEKVTWREIAHPALADNLQMQLLDNSGDDVDDDEPTTTKPANGKPSSNGKSPAKGRLTPK